MTDLLVTNGQVVTQNADREIIENGAVAVSGDRIEAVGDSEVLAADHDPDRTIDADGGAIIPGLIDAHVHVSDVLLRGAFAEDRGLYDWLYNANKPGVASMSPDEHAVAATLYCMEAIQAGVTTFVENDTKVDWDSPDTTEAKLEVYDESGIRNVYGAGITDVPPDEEFLDLVADMEARNPGTDHPPADLFTFETETALSGVESLIERYHGTADGRQSVWPSPVLVGTSSTEALQEAYRLAEAYDLMTTTHVAEAEIQDQNVALSSVEYLRNVGYLGERALLGHCVQIDDGDVRLLAETDTRVAHNYMANMRLATGYAPVVSMLDAGVAVGLGTDNANLDDTINPLGDIRAVAGGHKGYHRDPSVVQAETAFDMITIEGARAIGREADLGSIEADKQADIAIVDLDHPHLTPAPDPVFALVHAAQGFEIETLVCAGDVVMDGREIRSFDDPEETILEEASELAAEIVERTGIE